jgi:hypothetical protein
MLGIYNIPNKYFFWFFWIGALPILIWMAFGNIYFGIISAIDLFVMGLLSIIKPDLFPRFKIMYNNVNTENTFKISQIILGIAYILLGVYILYIGKIRTTVDIGIIVILFLGSVLIGYIIYEIKHPKIDNTITVSYVKSGIVGCVAFVILGIIFIFINAPMEYFGYPLIFGAVTGGGLGLLSLNRRTKKFKKEVDNNSPQGI